MAYKRSHNCLRLLLVGLLGALLLPAAEHHGFVKFGGLPVPGATVAASQGDKKLIAITDPQGLYSFPDLQDGFWNIRVEMLCFATINEEVTMASEAAIPDWELKLLPLDEIKASAGPLPSSPPPAPAQPAGLSVAPPEKSSATTPGKNSKDAKAASATSANPQGGFRRTDVNASAPANAAAASDSAPQTADASQSSAELNQRASDGFLVNGTTNNGASSPFALGPAFGNNRRGTKSLYNGNIGLIVDNSVLDANSFSLTGQNTPKPSYNHLSGIASFGGPLRIPHLIRNGPNFFINYQWIRNQNASTGTGLMPTIAQRGGDFSQSPGVIVNPLNGLPFAGNMIPKNMLSPQALALLNLYPLPNFDAAARYNYQIPLLGATHQDNLQSRLNKTLGRKDQLSGLFAFQNTRTDTPNLFNFLDTSDMLGINSNVTWRHSFTPRFLGTFQYQFSRLATRITPYFENRQNVSGEAGVSGNNQEPLNWGPPALAFSNGIQGLADAQASHNRNQTGAVSTSIFWNHNPHNITFGGDFRRQQFDYLSQQNPRGAFTFTGAATETTVNGVPVAGSGSAFADFLLGVPDTSSIAFGNADKYFRESVYDAFITDDWRINPSLTLNAGVRWEYGAPMTELYGRLVNLDVVPGFAAVAPVAASDPIGTLTGQHYPDSLVHPDKHAFQPRVAISWRPFAASSMVVRAGYGVYYNTSVYQWIAEQMAQQSVGSKNFTVANSTTNPLTLANGFNAPSSSTFAIDPNFQVGYSQNWQASVQRDLPGSLVATATYLGIKGTRGMQEFYPNTFPAGAANPCATCPSGFAYVTSNGNSTREAGTLQLRRRLHNGLTASLQYTYSKSIDDSALGGRGQATTVVAQNWLDLNAERSLSNFDQRHLVTLQGQYTTGMGVSGATLLNGWAGALAKEWTFVAQITAGTGLPETPTYFTPTNGTGFLGSVRADYTGAPIYDAPPGFSLNPAAYTAPATGQWGTAGRNSITGPDQFTVTASMGRIFRASERVSFDLRVDATNPLNHVTFPSWNSTVNSAQFGLPNAANAMRSLQTRFLVRF